MALKEQLLKDIALRDNELKRDREIYEELKARAGLTDSVVCFVLPRKANTPLHIVHRSSECDFSKLPQEPQL